MPEEARRAISERLPKGLIPDATNESGEGEPGGTPAGLDRGPLEGREPGEESGDLIDADGTAEGEEDDPMLELIDELEALDEALEEPPEVTGGKPPSDAGESPPEDAGREAGEERSGAPSPGPDDQAGGEQEPGDKGRSPDDDVSETVRKAIEDTGEAGGTDDSDEDFPETVL